MRMGYARCAVCGTFRAACACTNGAPASSRPHIRAPRAIGAQNVLLKQVNERLGYGWVAKITGEGVPAVRVGLVVLCVLTCHALVTACLALCI